MKSACRTVRERLTSACAGEEVGGLRAHLALCPACARYAERLEAARRLLEAHHTLVEPDAGFARRVVERLDGERPDLAGQAALRLLPAALVLLLALIWLSAGTASDPATLLSESPTEDLLSWALDEEGS
jgi:anti-sigma factor RsiW